MAARQFYAATPVAGPLSHTGDTVLTDAITLTFTPDASSSYYLLWSCERSINSASNRAEVDFLNATTPTTLGVQGSTERTSGDWMTTGGVSKETFGASPAPQTYKTQYKTTASASTAKVRDLTIVAVKAAATDVDSVVAGPITGTNTTLADVTGGPSVTVGAGTWLILASAELGNSASANFTRAQLTDGTNNYGTASLSPLTTASTVFKGWMTAVKVTTAGSTTYKLQASASAGTWSAQHLAIIAIDLSTFDNSGYQADLTRSSAVNPAGAWTTRSSLAYTPPAASLNHLVIHAMALDESGSGVNGQGRGTLGGVTQWASSESANAAFSTLEQQAAFGFYTTALAAGATTITNDFTSSTASATVGCASSVIAVLQLDSSGTPAAGTGSLTLSGSATASEPATGSLALTGSATAAASDTATASLSLTGSTTAAAPVMATASLALTATATWVEPASAAVTLSASAVTSEPGSGSLTLTGTATAAGKATTTGALTLAGTASWVTAAAGSVTLTGTASAAGAATASASVTLGATAAWTTTATGTLTLAGTSTAGAQTTAAASVTLAGSAAWVATASASVTLTASAAWVTTATGTVILTGTATTTVVGVTGTVTLTGSAGWATTATATLDLAGTTTTTAGASATASVTLAASGGWIATAIGTIALTGAAASGGTAATGTGTLTLTAAATAGALAGSAGTVTLTATATAVAAVTATATLTLTAAAIGSAGVSTAAAIILAALLTATADGSAAGQVTLSGGAIVVKVTPTPAERVYVVAAETRVYVVAREIRHISVAAESRTTTVPAETRTIRVPAENRTVEVV